jgi:hypothetical protein
VVGSNIAPVDNRDAPPAFIDNHADHILKIPVHSNVNCCVCASGISVHYLDVDGYPYFRCRSCRSIHVHPSVIHDMDRGVSIVRDYKESYWDEERAAARDRAAGVSLARAGEAILYCRRPVRHFLDVGAGPGWLLRNLIEMLDPLGEIFQAVEKFPPDYAYTHANYHAGGVESLSGTFDAGVCIEVVEHLTPRMLSEVAEALARVSQPGSFWLFNTGMDEYVDKEDRSYLDPLRRGHIVSYSVEGIRGLFEQHGFRVAALPGKSFAFYAEYMPIEEPPFDKRIYAALPHNVALLQRHPLLHHAAFESARSYYYQAMSSERTNWALGLKQLLDKARG